MPEVTPSLHCCGTAFDPWRSHCTLTLLCPPCACCVCDLSTGAVQPSRPSTAAVGPARPLLSPLPARPPTALAVRPAPLRSRPSPPDMCAQSPRRAAALHVGALGELESGVRTAPTRREGLQLYLSRLQPHSALAACTPGEGVHAQSRPKNNGPAAPLLRPPASTQHAFFVHFRCTATAPPPFPPALAHTLYMFTPCIVHHSSSGPPFLLLHPQQLIEKTIFSHRPEFDQLVRAIQPSVACMSLTHIISIQPIYIHTTLIPTRSLSFINRPCETSDRGRDETRDRPSLPQPLQLRSV